ncbi:hypothetical protein BBK36DRAFT_1168396 [Trichoderma citrinoviride]|uniref:Linalool dehydratase/isomerase domain-containing protein n=1 Tax=Trichoderma citrinoviride TaxID=58853 RepID=A0A2T4BC25_9HYPO|nr:hypothetical protein BBK36DRAFT_1168396 [Trichoderma citrinoviride]PTB66877.1 hypothetical protein BBK36DRAFT_1168396 [Trichoderma citrinoviride]
MGATPRPGLSLDLSKYDKLDAAQAGHLRHFHNLASQMDGEWHHMGTQEPMQEFLDAYRYQLATMAYAVGVAHYHRLPALRSSLKTLMRRLIHKMMRREVWSYWFNTSLSGNRTDPDRTELRKPWADPVVRENIMYSGHLLLMTSLYGMLFDDDEFEKSESLTFRWDPLFFGFGTETFHYDNRSLQEAIIREMERNGWVGVCCEPNLVFIVCNQFPIIAMKYNDARDGTNVSDQVLEKYKAAWEKKGMVAPSGLYVDWYFVRQDKTLPPKSVGFSAWANAYMNTWNSETVKSLYDQQVYGFITSIDGKVQLQEDRIAQEYRKLVDTEKADKNDASVLARARASAAALPPSKMPFSTPTFGYVVQWLSELGKKEELKGLLKYADEHLQPTWEEGGLFYPRNDVKTNEAGEWTHMDPFSGNASIGYARLNVPDGQKKMWDSPRVRGHAAMQPWIDGIDLDQGIDCLRGVWDGDEGALVVTMKTWDGRRVTAALVANNLPGGSWCVFVNGELVQSVTVKDGGDVRVEIEVGGEELDVVFKRGD